MTPEADIVVVRGRIAELARTPLLAPCEQRRADALPPAAAMAFVAGRSVLRRLLGRWLDRDPRPIRFHEEPDAKPRLDRDADLDFNVAHGGDHVLVALARGRHVGVDVEPISSRRAVTAIAEAALGPDAVDQLRRLPVDRRAARFTCWWVRIEALCKATGAGLTFPVDDTMPAGFAVRDVAMPRHYRAAVAFDGAAPPRLAILDWSPA
jgi:4'-phosphopantetheinyl transferase